MERVNSQEDLLFGTQPRGCCSDWTWDVRTWSRRRIMIVAGGAVTGLALVISFIAVLAVATRSADIVVPTSPAPVITTTTASTTTTTTMATTPTTTTPTTTTPTTTTPTTTTPTTTTTQPTTTTITTTTTTKKPTTTTLPPPPTPPTPTPPFQPSTAHPLPHLPTNLTAVAILNQVGVVTNYTEVPCLNHIPPTFKYVLTIEGHEYTGEADRKHDAQEQSARNATGAFWGLKFDRPILPPHKPCLEPEIQINHRSVAGRIQIAI